MKEEKTVFGTSYKKVEVGKKRRKRIQKMNSSNSSTGRASNFLASRNQQA